MTFTAKGPPRWGSANGHVDAVCLLSSSAADVQTNSPRRPNTQIKFQAPRAVAANKPAAGRRVRLQYLARRLHGLGERPLFHFLDEVERGADLRPHLERYAALPADFIKANGGDKFAPIVRVIDGGEP
jgi:hypothetical protein